MPAPTDHSADHHQTDERVHAIVAELTLEEKAAMTAGSAVFALQGVPRLGIPNLPVTDGPNGARGSSLLGSGEARAVCVPCGSALGATWDPELVEAVGELLGDETRTKQARVLLAPTVNLHRSPLGGRNFECYSEDPLLSGKIAAGFVRGVQSRGVATTVKHFVGNDAETERNTMNSVIDDRALRELYLVPFEIAVREGRAVGIMSSYNRVNGRHCTEQRELLTDILRGDWGFDGFVMSDWFSAAHTANSMDAGLDIEMPGPGRAYGPVMADAVRDGRVDDARLTEVVTRQLSVLARLGALDDEVGPEQSIDLPAHRVLARRASSDSIVMLKNDGVLPLDLSGGGVKTVAVIGPNASRTQIMGGGSANLRPMYRTSVLDAVREQFGASVDVVFEPGCAIDRIAPSVSGAGLTGANGEQGFDIEMFTNARLEGDAVATSRRDTGRLLFMEPPAGVDLGDFSFRARANYRPVVTGVHTFEIIQLGRSRVLLDGAVILDGITTPPPAGTTFFGLGSAPIVAAVDLDASKTYEIVVEYHTTPGLMFPGVDLGCRLPLPADPIGAAVAAAANADAVVLVVGTNDDWETEGEDRASMDLPGDQDELVYRVLAANANTVVVVNSGAPVTMPWADEPCAIVQSWFGGQEMANALADVISGAAEPAGRLPTTLPVTLEHNPSYGNFPGERSEIRYGEGVLIGYRWYQTRKLPVRFPFGHGMSYTSFRVGGPVLSAATFAAGATVTVSVDVTNTGSRRGAEVVQCYVTPPASGVTRPVRELRAFAKVWLDPNETRTVRLTLTDRAFAFWDPAEPGYAAMLDHVGSSMSMADRSPRNETPGWRIEAGEYHVHIGTSCDAIVGSSAISVPEGVLLPPTT